MSIRGLDHIEQLIDATGSVSPEDFEEVASEILCRRGFCGCGDPMAAAAFLRKVLELAPFYDKRKELKELIPDPGMFWFVLYMVAKMGLIEHSSDVSGYWLTDEGEKMRTFLQGLSTQG